MNRFFDSGPTARPGRKPRAFVAGVALLALAACTPASMTPDVGRVYLNGPGDPLLDAAPPMGLALAGPGRRLLPNETALPGENFISTTRSGGFAGFGIDGALRRAGALPTPFEFAIARDFAPLQGGAYSYVARSPEPGVTCVLVIGSGGPYASGYSTMMRNCVQGDLARALAPLTSAV